MVVTGITQHRLDYIKSYDPLNPYIVGVNGVDTITHNSLGEISKIKYVIGDITYVTEFVGDIKISGNTIPPNLNDNDTIRSYRPIETSVRNERRIVYPTTFSYTTQPIIEEEYFIFKEDVKMGVVFPPKVQDEIFIERQRVSVFETHSRLSEINSLEDLIEYRNGFYNVTNLE